jgi:hypothetical protein
MKNVLIIGALLVLVIIIIKSLKTEKSVIENENENPSGVKLGQEVGKTTVDLTNQMARDFKAPAPAMATVGVGNFELNPMFHVCPACNR